RGARGRADAPRGDSARALAGGRARGASRPSRGGGRRAHGPRGARSAAARGARSGEDRVGGRHARRQRAALRAARLALPPVRLTHDATRGELQIAVGDDGPGIPPERLPWLLARPPGASRAVGVALMLVRDVVAAHGGRVTVDSRVDGPDHGTTFTISLPTR